MTALPYGLRDVKLTPIESDGSYGAMVDLPNGRTFSFAEAEEFSELRGDDQLVAIRGNGAEVNWSLEGGGISLEAWKVMAGGTVDESGTEPDIVKTYSKKGTDTRPYFRVDGKAISDSGGDFHVSIYRCRATDDLEGEMQDGEFWLSGAGGRAMPDPNHDGALYDFVQNPSETEITQPTDPS